MKKTASFISIIFFLLIIAEPPVLAKEEALMRVIRRITDREIVPLAGQTIVVDAVKEANKEATKSLDEIIQLDNKWRATYGIDEWIGGFLNNPCADYLRRVQRDAAGGSGRSLYAEIFVMDKQGNIVSETDKTTDYWQADEDKFIKSFAYGKGDIFIGEAIFGESTNRYLIQVSAPILDIDTRRAIGVITVGIDLDVLM
jgi:hypothetical protein